MKRNGRRGHWVPLTLGLLGVLAAACGGSSKPTPATSADGRDSSPSATASPAPSPTPTPPASTEDGLRLLSAGDTAGAVGDLVAAAEASTGAARGDALVALARAYDTRGEPDKATDALRRAVAEGDPGSTSDTRARVALGVRLTTASTALEAIDALRPFEQERSAGPLQPYALAALGAARDAAGDAPGARVDWQLLLAGWNEDSTFAAQAHAGLASAAWALGDTATYFAEEPLALALAPDSGARLLLANRLRDAGDTAGAVAQLNLIVNVAPASAAALPALDALDDLGAPASAGASALVYYRGGELPKLVDMVSAVAAAQTGSDGAQAMYFLGAAYEDLDSFDEAVAAYDQAAALDPGSATANRAQYWAAHVLEGEGEDTDAAARYATLAAGPAGPFSAEAAFRAGYLPYLAGDFAGALAAWSAVPAQEGARELFWEGKARTALGDSVAARASWTAAAVAGGSWLYSRLATAALAGGSWPETVAYQPRTLHDAVETAAEVVPDPALAELAAAGLTDQAYARVGALCSGATGGAAVVETAHALGLTSAAIRCALAEGSDVDFDSPLAYPLRYVVSLDATGKSANLDPLFLAAMVRQESLWQPDVGSGAGAIGLAQLIPDTADHVAAQLGLQVESTTRLHDPVLSLQLGSTYLRDQLAAFGNPALALAAYNAGPANAARWGEAGGDLADRLERIDFVETRAYVDGVLEQYGHYMEAYGAN